MKYHKNLKELMNELDTMNLNFKRNSKLYLISSPFGGFEIIFKSLLKFNQINFIDYSNKFNSFEIRKEEILLFSAKVKLTVFYGGRLN